jgi:hypothetical protein
MSQAGEGSRKPESAKRAGLEREAVIAAAHRSPRRSSLFWWLFDHYDELGPRREAQGISLKSMCAGTSHRTEPGGWRGNRGGQ